MSAMMTVFLKSSIRDVGKVGAVGESVASGAHRALFGVGRVQRCLRGAVDASSSQPCGRVDFGRDGAYAAW